jgi:predicted nucleic acid binding AN1-type Zn finger protein
MTTIQRCSEDICRKKINIMSFECKFCHSNFCCSHQLPEKHNCNIKQSDFYETFRLMNNLDYSTDSNKHKKETPIYTMGKGRLTRL